MAAETAGGSFWDHLDELRAVLLRILLATALLSIVAFCFREALFGVVLAPSQADFATYRLIDRLAALAGGGTEPFAVPLINTGLARQFIVHMKTALCAGLLCASPYILYQLFRFVSPALHADERRYAVRVAGGGYLMFLAGAGVSYYLVFPLAFRFLGTYRVAPAIDNLITLDSYISTLLTMTLSLGIVFEIPVLAWFFARLGLVSAAFLRHYRRHAVILILVVAAVITPTTDVFTLTLVALPMWLLYEAGILLARRAGPRGDDSAPL